MTQDQVRQALYLGLQQLKQDSLSKRHLQVQQALIDAGLSLERDSSQARISLSPQRRSELAQLFAVSGPLSEIIITERDGLMSNYYADSSVLVKRHIRETGSA